MNFPRIIDNNLGIDYLGVIVSILSILVTVLIGWDIYKAMNLDKRMENIVNEKMQILKEYTDQSKNISIMASLAQLGVSLKYNNDICGAFRSLMNALMFAQEIDKPNDNNKDLYNEVYENIIKRLIDTLNVIGNENTILPGDQDEYEMFLITVKKTDNKELIKLFRKKVNCPKTDKTN